MAINVDISKITGINQVGNSYQRKSAVPLDYYSFFNTKAAAETYAASNPVAYIGQYVAYTHEGKVFACVIADEAGTLKEIGSKPIGDNASIEVAEDGKVSLYGFNELTNDKVRYLPVTKLVGEGAEAHLEIEWVSELADATRLAQAASVTEVGDDTSYAIEAVRADKDGNLAVVLPKQPVIDLIKAEVGSAGHLKREIVDVLPDVTDADPDTIYMIKTGGPNAVMQIITEGHGDVVDGQISLDGQTSSKHIYEVQVTPGATYKVSSSVSIVTADYYIKNEAGKYILAGELDTNDEVVPGVEFDYDYQDSLTIPADAAAVNGIATCVIAVDEGMNITSITPVQVGGDQYKEYMLVDGVFEQIGDTTVNLEGYATEDYVDNKLEAYAKIGDAYTKEEMAPILYEGAYVNGEGVQTPSNISEDDRVNARLISPEEIRKLSVLEIGENGIEISGIVDAANVKGLAKAIEDQVTAETGLGIEEGAEVNIIETVKVNGEALKPDANRAVNIVIPTSHVNDVVVRAKETNGEDAVTYESKLKATRSDETNVITLDDSALQDAINAVNNNVVHSISVNKAPVNADSEHHVNITAETGTQIGTIAIAGQDVAVKGLGTAAFENKGAFKLVQEAVTETDVTSSAFTGTTLSYLATITQNEQGVITATKQTYNLKTNVLDPIAVNKSAIENIYKKADDGTPTGLLPSLQQEVAANKTAIEHIYKNENGVESGLLPALKKTVGDHTTALATLIGTVEGDNTKSVRQIAEAVAKAEVGSAGHLKREIVTELPNVAEADLDTIYMIKDTEAYGTTVKEAPYDAYGKYELIDGKYEVVEDPTYNYKYAWIGLEDQLLAPGKYYFDTVGDDFEDGGEITFVASVNAAHEPAATATYDATTHILTVTGSIYGLVVNIETVVHGAVRIRPVKDQYKEYIVVNGAFEQIGDTSVNLDGYATEDFVRQLVTNSAPGIANTTTLGLVKSTAAGTSAATNKVTVETNGTMTVTKISTDILVNGNEEFILFGGTASTAVRA